MSDGEAKGFDIGEAFDKILSAQEEAETPVVESAETEPEKPARDEQGRFAPKAEEAPEEPAKEPEATPEAEKTDPEPEAPQPPERLPKEIREEWGKLSEPVRAAIEKRERETHDIVTRVDRERQVGRSFDQTVQEYRDIIDADGGGKPEVAVRNLLHTARMLRTADPDAKAQLLNQIATMYDIDIERAYYSRPQPEIARAQLAIQQRDAQLAYYRAQEQQAQTGQIEQTIEQFAASVPYFAEAAPEMERLARAGVSTDLQTLYNMAIAANDALRSTSIAQQAEALAQAKLAEEKAKQDALVAKARHAAVSPPSASGHAKPPGIATLDPLEAMSLEYDAIIARYSG